MNNRLALLLAATVCAAALAAPAAWADAAADAAKSIQAAYDVSNAALGRKDVAGAQAYRTPDFIAITADGKTIDLAHERVMLGQFFAAAKTLQAASKIVRLELHGTTATVRVDEHLEMQVPGAKTGKLVEVAERDTSRDTWVQTPDGWRIRRSQSLNEATTVDGKPVEPAQR